ncbi:MAG: hypothetical protein ACLQU3_16680, partial [Limisphaerales bacterium]
MAIRPYTEASAVEQSLPARISALFRFRLAEAPLSFVGAFSALLRAVELRACGWTPALCSSPFSVESRRSPLPRADTS